jgi:prephenate dehydrogenase
MIIGLGLMGGSLARDLAALGVRLVVADVRPEVMAAALDEGIAVAATGNDLSGAGDVDLVVIATPVDEAREIMDRLAPHLAPETIVSDLGSTKLSISRQAEAVGIGDRFVGSHPLTGDHRSGWAASRKGLFDDAHVFVCPTSSTRADIVKRMEGLWATVGARTEVVNPEDHDRRMAWVSHLPQIASSALALALRDGGFDPSDLGPGGRDVLRLAGSGPEVWGPICLDNADNVVDAIDDLQQRLSRLRSALGERRAEAIASFFELSRAWHRSSDD